MTTRKKIISVIGNAHLDEDSEKYRLGRRLGKALIDNDYRIVNGGMFGIMEAVARGAKESESYAEGSVIGISPFFDPQFTNDYLDVIVPTGLDSYRNVIVANSDAVVAIGGGAGTLSEMAMAWILKRMIIAYDVDGWSGKIADTRIDERKRIDWGGDKVFRVTSESEVIQLLNNHLKHYTKRHTKFKQRKFEL